MNIKKLLNELRSIKSKSCEIVRVNGKPEIVDTEVSPTVFERDGRVIVSAEDGNNFADYYSDHIDARLESIAEKYDGYFEWENPGAISFSGDK